MQLSPTAKKAIASTAQNTIILEISGMKCAGCVKAVERQLLQHPGVTSASVNLALEIARVDCIPGAVDEIALAKKLTNTGFPANPRYSPEQIAAKQQKPDCFIPPAERHRREIQQLFWKVALAAILILLSGLGHITSTDLAKIPLLNGEKIPLINNIWFHWGLATAAILGPGQSIVIDGWLAAWRRTPTMNTLIGLGALASYTASCVALFFPQLGWECFFDEPVMMLGFILLGRTLEHIARRRAAAALEALIDLQPYTARLVPAPNTQANQQAATSATSVEIPVAHVKVGEYLQVLPGEKIPVDGEVIAGSSTVNESMLTGEPMPVFKQPGATVSAGTLNLSGMIVVRATRTGSETTLAQIVALVEEAQTRKAPIQQLADTVAGYFTYGVITIAALTFIFWYFVGTQWWDLSALAPHTGLSSFYHPFYHPFVTATSHSVSPTQYSSLLLSLKLAIAVLVIACPCALGLATPTALLVGTSLGAERGLLIRGGDILERIAQIDTVVFDKTGTLTVGSPAVTDCLPLTENSLLTAEALLQLAATVESGTRHPIADALVQEIQRLSLPLLDATDFHTEPGLGVRALVNGQRVVLGSGDWLQAHGITVSEAILRQARELAVFGKTVVYVAVGDAICGIIAVADRLRADAKATVERLQRLGLRVMLLTGDTREAADVVARELGLTASDVLANVCPQDKAAALARLQEKGYRVAMVGDGINDAPALAQADCGIALHSGTAVAVETAGIILMQDRLLDVVASIELSRSTFNKIRQNLFWAFIYNLLAIPLAAGVLLPTTGIALSPAAAGALMAFSSVSVVLNSLLLRGFFSPKLTAI